MHRLILYFVFVLVIAHGCKPASYLKTPNNVFKKQGTLYMLNGAEKKGAITINLGNEHTQSEYILLTTAAGEEKISPDSIGSYKIGEDHFFPKKIDLYFEGAKRFLLVKRLTKENLRIQLYELYQEARETVDGLNDNYYYFISLPGQGRLEAWSAAGKNLVPDFNLKMSIQVKDCPALAQKIMEKKKGYFFVQYTMAYSKKLEVLKRIIEEYNNCR